VLALAGHFLAAGVLAQEGTKQTNQDFDNLVFPNRNHSYSGDPYFIRRRWDYLVANLLGATPPKGYQIKNGSPNYHPVDAQEPGK
jgi:hypothetical protein